MIGPNRSSSECVELRFATTPTSARLAGFSAGCDRLVHPAVTDADERARQRRLIGVMLAAPFVLGMAAVQAFAGGLETAALLAGLCALFGVGWLGALLVASTGKRDAVGAPALALAAIATGASVAAAGGLASPMALLVMALIFESCWVSPSRRAAYAGGAAATAALLTAAAASWLVWPDAAAPSAAQWLAPAAYAVTLWLRYGAAFRTAEAGDETNAPEALETLLDAVVVRLSRGGEVLDASAQARRLLNLPPELLLGNGLFERLHVADRVAWLTALADLRDGAAARSIEMRLRLPSEEPGQPAVRYLPFSAELVAAGDAVAAVIRDNREIAGLRANLLRAEERAESDDLAKSRFLAAVSHELRTPLNAIIGFSDMLMHEIYGGFTDPRQKEYTGLIRESGHHLLTVVNSILDVSKIESGAYPIHPEPFQFGEAAQMCRSMMAPQAQVKAIRLEDRVAPGLGDIRGDRRAIQQVLINLVSNAVKFTPEGGEVVIGAKRLGSRLVFWVSDNGIGIAEEDLARLGQPFTQVQNDYTRRYDGAGLGLSLVKGLVTLHEGSLSIESAPGRGTTVTVSLPCEGPAETAGAGSNLVALPMDDDAEDRNETLRKTA